MSVGATTFEAGCHDSHLRGDVRGVEQAGVCVCVCTYTAGITLVAC